MATAIATQSIIYDDEEDETPEEEKIPKLLKNNFYLGDLIEIVIDLENPEKEVKVKKDIPN